MTRARILLADDHDLFREGLAGLINAQADLEVAGQAGDGLEALTLARDLKPELIVMDINMPICDGLEATRLIRAEWAEARIVMLTVHDEDAKLFEAIKSGAQGYMLKSLHSAEFLRGVRSALNGEAVLPPKLAGHLLTEFARLSQRPAGVAASPAEADVLTAREQEVLDLIATGATDKVIAEKLSLSLHTVKSHVRNILSKTHAVNRRHAAKLTTRK
ncbi:MAG: response regulator transcription factor [Thermoflexales bacterium]|nr:response regulator transcription factor [Thermoflexales bacterium]